MRGRGGGTLRPGVGPEALEVHATRAWPACPARLQGLHQGGGAQDAGGLLPRCVARRGGRPKVREARGWRCTQLVDVHRERRRQPHCCALCCAACSQTTVIGRCINGMRRGGAAEAALSAQLYGARACTPCNDRPLLGAGRCLCAQVDTWTAAVAGAADEGQRFAVPGTPASCARSAAHRHTARAGREVRTFWRGGADPEGAGARRTIARAERRLTSSSPSSLCPSPRAATSSRRSLSCSGRRRPAPPPR